MAEDPENEVKRAIAPTLEGGTYEIIRKRLNDHAGELRERLEKLNALRREVFGSIETVLLRADRITTEHNCVPRDMAPLGDHRFLFGYNVQFGLKTEIKLEDVFACYEYFGEGFQQAEMTAIHDPRFEDDFKSLYKYYKNTRFVKFSFIGPFLFMVFRVGKDVSDVKTFKWNNEGGKLTYIDNRSDHEFKFPAQYEFDWKRTHRELHRSGLSPHIAIDDRVFVECINGDLTIKVEDNTETGEGIYSEPVAYKDQTLDDAEIFFAISGNLVLLKIRPFQEKAFRFFVFNDKMKTVHRVDGIAEACVMLPEDQGIIFSNGYYLQTGVLKLFETDRTDMMFERLITSNNGEDYFYVFYNRSDGDYVLMSYNLIAQEVANPIWCHGFSLYENGELTYFKAHQEPQKHHTIQVWQTPYVAAGRERHAKVDSFLYKIGNRDVVRAMAECHDVLNLVGKDESYAGLYLDIVKVANDVADSYFWVGKAEVYDLKSVLLQIKEVASKAVDEHQKVIRIRAETGARVKKVHGEADKVFHILKTAEFDSVELFVENLAELRRVRGETISLKDLRYVDPEIVSTLEQTVVEAAERLSRGCVDFLLLPAALDPYRKRVAEHEAEVEQFEKVAVGRELEEAVGETGGGLELLIDIVTNLKIDDATETTRIIDGITDVYTTLNQVKVAVRKRIKSLMEVEGAAQFNAELKLLNQAVINYLDICDTPDKCEEYLNKVMVQFEELEGRFADFDEYTVQLADKRTEVYEAFEARKLNLIEARNRKTMALMSSAERILKVIRHRVEGMKTIDEINGYMAGDLMIEKIRSTIGHLVELGDTVKADDLQGRLKSVQQDGVRQLKDKLELFADGANVIRLGKHKFSVNTQPLDLTVVRRDGDMHLHLTGTKYFSEIEDEAFLATRPVWDQEVVSENDAIYRAEYLAHSMLEWLAGGGELDLEAFANLEEAGQLEAVRRFMGPRYAESYTKGVHDHDAAVILVNLVKMHGALGLARFGPAARAFASVWWRCFCPEKIRLLWAAKLRGFGEKNRHYPGGEQHAGYVAELRGLLSEFAGEHRLFDEGLVCEAAEYLFNQLCMGEDFVIGHEAAELYAAFGENLLSRHLQEAFDAARKAVSEDPGSEYDQIREWLRGFVLTAKRPAAAVDEAAALYFCDAFDPRFVVSEATSVKIEKLRGSHALVTDSGYRLDYLEFLPRLLRYRETVVPMFESFQREKKSVVEAARESMRLHEFKPRVLTSFVRNRLIDEVYLPMIGDNLAKQIGAAGDKKRTDLMGLLLLISPPGYGKTTLMEYVANRLGVIFMKINGPALGHQITSLDPSEARNAAAREEIEKLNLALEMGDNVMLYLDDIQHCNPELLQKFISLCDAQRKIEGVYQGKPRTYDLRGRKVVVVMAGNPYTESGDKFQIPDMLANRADTYNLGDILGGHADAFKMSYLENAVTSNPVLQSLTNRSQKDIQTFIRIAETGARDDVEFAGNYSAEEIGEIVDVMGKLLRVRDVILTVNMEYIRSAGQADEYRTEPAFKLQGSYRNMNRLAEKVLPIMNDDEINGLIIDHYEQESQTLTTGAEANVLKFRELIGIQTDSDKQRWADIKKTFKRNLLLGGAEGGDPVSRVVAQMTAFSEGLDGIRGVLESGAGRSPEVKIELGEVGQLLATLGADVREGLNAWKIQDREDIKDFTQRIAAVNSGLASLKEIVDQYMRERKVSRSGGGEGDVDLSGIAVSQDTLSMIYELIDKDPKVKGGRQVKPPTKTTGKKE